MAKKRSKTKDGKKSILKKKVKRNRSGILSRKALRGKGYSTTWPVAHSSSNFTDSIKRKKAKSKKGTRKNIQNTKKLTELGRMNKNNGYQT